MVYSWRSILLIKKSLFLITAGLLCYSVNHAQIAQFGGPERNGVYPETGLRDQWPAEGPELVGTITGIGDGYASPTVTEDGIYIAGMVDSTGYVFHFNNDLQLQWKTAVGPEFDYKYVGARGAPTIEGNRLYYIASMGDAVCLNTSTGEKIWHIDFADAYNAPKIKWGYTESPLIYGEKIFFTPGGPGQNFVALDKMNGELIWAASIDSTVNSYCSPVIIQHKNQDLILLNSRDYILVIDPDDGKVLVKHPLTDSHFNHALPPIYENGTLFYSSGYGEGSTLFRMVEGQTLMDTIYTNKDLDAKISGMILYQGTVFGVSDKRKQWAGIDIASGKTVFTSRDLKPGSFILADNKFYMYSDVGEVALAQPSADGFTIVSRFQIPAGRASLAFAHPVIFRGILYIRYQDNLWLYNVQRSTKIQSFDMTMEQVIAEMKPYAGPQSDAQVETGTVLGKVMCGYQGWFRAPGDGSGQGWVHWGRGSSFNEDSCTIDYWPDTRELTSEEKYPTDFKHADGSTAYVFSSMEKKTVLRHFEWMKEAGIHGVFLQRFINGTEPPIKLYGYTKVLDNVREGANTYGRSWAVMYDMSGARNAERAIRLFKTDWKRLVDHMKIGNDPNDVAYQHHHGKPLVAIWGLFENREGMPEFYNEIIDFVKNDPVYGGFSVMIGSENYWREGTGEKYEILREAVSKADIISPWTVGRYKTPGGAEAFIKEMHGPDIAWCKAHNIDFLPVIFPGFSWHNLKVEPPLDQIPRLQGHFLWRQVYENLQVDAKMFYVAMFDEVDEGTAIFKVHPDPPVGNSPFLDYNGLPSDHYMWLAGKAQEALQGRLEVAETPPDRPGVRLNEEIISQSK